MRGDVDAHFLAHAHEYMHLIGGVFSVSEQPIITVKVGKMFQLLVQLKAVLSNAIQYDWQFIFRRTQCTGGTIQFEAS